MNLNPVSIVQGIIVWDWLIVDLYLKSVMTQVCMNRVGKVKCRTAIFLVYDFTMRCKHIECVRACTNVGSLQDNTLSAELVGMLIQLIPPCHFILCLARAVR